MREKGVIRCKSKYLSAFLVLVMLIGMITFSSGTAEAWDAQASVGPQEVYTEESTEVSITVENTGTDPMKVELVTISFGWQEEGKWYTPFEGEKVISPGEEATFTSTIAIPGGIQTNTRYDRETTIVASDPDGSGGWQNPYPKSYSGRVLVSESSGFGGLGWLGLIGIILLLISGIALVAFKYLKKEDQQTDQQSPQQQAPQQPSTPPTQQRSQSPQQQQTQQLSQQKTQQTQQQPHQQSSVPPPTQQSSQQPGGQQQPQQSQQSPAPPSPKKCPSCNAEMRYIDEHNS